MTVVILTTILALSALYAPQPLLPVLAAEFAVGREAAAFLTTVTFLPLSVAPLFYGYLLESLPPRRLLRGAVLLLALSEVLFFFGRSFSVLVVIRLCQGILIPAVLTALMTHIALVTRSAAVQRAMGIYVAATILGGFLGRACSGLIASWLGWRFSFLLLAAALLLVFFLLRRMAGEAALSLARPTPRTLLTVLQTGPFLKVYLMTFCLFLVFAAVMNYLPFRLTELSDLASEFRIGLMYSGYLMGVVTSLGATRVTRRLGGEVATLAAGLLLFAAALLALGAGEVATLFAVMFFFCGAMFLVHATASGYLNRCASGNKGIVNGLYVSFYYAGGAVGSWLPGYVYRLWGWKTFVLTLLLVVAVALLLALSVRGETAVDRQRPAGY